MANNAKRQISVFLNGKQVESTAKNIAAAFRETSNELANLVVGSDKYLEKLEDVRKYDGALKEHRDALRGVEQGWSLSKVGLAGYIGVAAGAFTVDAIVGYGKELFNTATNLELMEKKARTVFGDALPLVTAEAERSARAMGLTNAEYVAQAAAIQDLLVPMGFQRKEAAELSTGLQNLSGALAEWSGGQYDAKTVSEILAKSLLGERDALNGLGIDIKQAEVDAELLARGMDKLTGAAAKQAEATVTLDLILQKSTDAQAAYADGADSMARKTAEAEARFAEAKERLATALIPIFERLIALATPVVEFFSDVAEGVSGLIDPAQNAAKAFEDQSRTVANLERDLNPLLTRYDQLTAKTNLTKEEQAELAELVKKINEVVPIATTSFDRYGNAMGVSTAKAREFIEAEKEKLKILNANKIEEYNYQLRRLQHEEEILKRSKETGKGIREFGVLRPLSNEELQEVNRQFEAIQAKIKGTKQILNEYTGESLGQSSTPPPTPAPNAGDAGGGGKTGPSDEAEKKREKEEADLKDHLARIKEIVEKNRDEERLRTLSTDEQEIERIRQKYQKEIEQVQSKFAKQGEVKAAVAELERQRDAEIAEAEAAQREAKVDAEIEAYFEDQERIDAAKQEYAEGKAEAEAAIKEAADEALLSERELELQKLAEHYAELLKLAEQYGIDTTNIKLAYAKKQGELEKKFAEKSAKDQADSQEKRLKAMGDTFQAFGDLASATFDLIGDQSEDSAELQKIFTLAKIAFDTAAAISSLVAAANANPANSTTFGAAGAAQFIAGLAQIVANIALAKKTLSGAPKVTAKGRGGFLEVTGDADGQRYAALPVTAPGTGMLPGFPVLFQSNATGQPVLASERGAEYFVAAHDLRNPYVANLVRMIDNITHSSTGIPQFATGGANPPSATSPGSAALPAQIPPELQALIAQIGQTLNALNSVLSGGIVAVVPDRTVTDIVKRFEKINDASGGFFS